MDALQRYLHKRSLSGDWRLAGRLPDDPLGAVVIPSLAEGGELLATLDSLDRCEPELRRRFAVVVVVNRSESGDAQGAEVNDRDLQALARRSGERSTCPLAWVDASSAGLALPAKDAGVGLARKLGFDLVLAAFGDDYRRRVLVSLDADTRVEPSYLRALVDHFAGAEGGGCTLPFCHRPGRDGAGQEAIERYELYLRAYVAGLEGAGSPYAYHTVGSAMAWSGDAYVKAGGMNRRKAGEDFYFLQQLAKTSKVEALSGTTVYPSARVSRRTPFGTGRVVERQLQGEEAVRFYAPETFAVLRDWLGLVAESRTLSGHELMRCARTMDDVLATYLDAIGMISAWDRLQRNFRTRASFERGFHGWFDALRTLRLLHALEVHAPRSADVQTVARQLGRPAPAVLTEMLQCLRFRQGVAV